MTRRGACASLALLALAATLAHAALGPRYGGTLRVGLLDLPAATAPAAPAGPGQRLVQALVHETLVGVGPEGLPTPGLARAWTSAAGGREWTLSVHERARFHDDRPVTAADALRSLRRFLRSPSSAAARLAQALEGGEAFRARHSDELPGLGTLPGERVLLRLVAARALPLAPLGSPAAAITSPGGAGAGPFVPTVLVPGRRLALNAFAGHVRGRPYLDELELLPFADRAALKTALQAGDLAVALGEPGIASPTGTLLLVLDRTQAPFDRSGARAAAAAAVDRAELVRHWLPGGDASAGLLAPGLLPALASAPAVAPATGRARIALVVARDVPPAASQRVVACLGEAGFDVRVLPDAPERARRAASEARLLLFVPEVAETALALHELAALVSPPPAAREALEAAGLERDLDRRRALLLRAEAELRADLTLVPLAAAPLGAASAPGVHDLRVDAGGRVLLESAWREP